MPAACSNNILPYAALAFAEADPVKRLKLLAQGFLKADGEPYDPSKTFKKALLDRLPDLPERYRRRRRLRSSPPPTGWRCSACWRARGRR